MKHYVAAAVITTTEDNGSTVIHDVYCACGEKFYGLAVFPHRIQEHIEKENKE